MLITALRAIFVGRMSFPWRIVVAHQTHPLSEVKTKRDVVQSSPRLVSAMIRMCELRRILMRVSTGGGADGGGEGESREIDVGVVVDDDVKTLHVVVWRHREIALDEQRHLAAVRRDVGGHRA